MAPARRRSVHQVLESHFRANPDLRRFYNGVLRAMAGISHKDAPFAREVLEFIQKSVVGVVPDIGMMTGGFPVPIGHDLYDIQAIFGAFNDLGVVNVQSASNKLPKVTGNPSAYWFTPASFNTTIPADTSLTGANLTPESNTLACLINCSREWLQDKDVILDWLPVRIGQGMAMAMDWACFSGQGGNNTTDGSQTGIFYDNTLASVNSAEGNTTISQLQRADFLAAIAALNPYALQRPCRWFINPTFIAQLLTLVDGTAKSYLSKTPGETEDGEWYLCGFPITWVAQSPSATAPGSKIAAFGDPRAYGVMIREFFELILSDSTGFASNQMSFRAIARAFCQTRESSGLVTLALSQA
jgi:HK97 family phage major capsid protein